MLKAHRYLSAGILTAGLLLALPPSVSAQSGYWSQNYRLDDRAHDNGYRQGLAAGERDARDRRAFSFAQNEDYRQADVGFMRGDGDLSDYRRFFREGFEAGYREGYDRVAQENRYIAPRYGSPYPVMPTYLSPAAEIGFRDGLETGRHDGHNGDAYDPVKADRFRSADHNYDRRFGSREDFRREYRAGFEQGYAEGYRGR